MNALREAKACSSVSRPVYEFRPLPKDFPGGCRRYAGGEWIDDDGEHDIAFISNRGFGPPIHMYVEHGYQKNIVSGWYDKHWSDRDPRHPGGNAWHYALADGEAEWGGDWGRANHENYRGSRMSSNKLCSESSCANGRGVKLTDPSEPHIAAGLVRDRDTKEVFRPTVGTCMYCGNSNEHKIAGQRARVLAAGDEVSE